jgi:hypothetical protein
MAETSASFKSVLILLLPSLIKKRRAMRIANASQSMASQTGEGEVLENEFPNAKDRYPYIVQELQSLHTN